MVRLSRRLTRRSPDSRDTTLPAEERSSKRSAVFPNPPVLTDGEKPTFRVWVDHVKSKLRVNADWYDQEDEVKAERTKIDFIKIFVEGKAADHLYSWLEAEELRGNTDIAVEEALLCLEKVFLDKDRRLKARTELGKLKMAYLGDFNEFHTTFLKLANTAQLPKAQWKEDFHDKLYDSLRVMMEAAVSNENKTFEAYCDKAQHFARGLVKAGENTRERAKELKKRKSNPKVSKKSDTTATTPTTSTRTTSTEVKCYICGQTGHITRSCPNKQQDKVKPESKAVDSDSSGSEKDLL